MRHLLTVVPILLWGWQHSTGRRFFVEAVYIVGLQAARVAAHVSAQITQSMQSSNGHIKGVSHSYCEEVLQK